MARLGEAGVADIWKWKPIPTNLFSIFRDILWPARRAVRVMALTQRSFPFSTYRDSASGGRNEHVI